MLPVIETKCMNIYVNEQHRYEIMEWKGFGKDEEIIDVITSGLKLVREKKLTKLMVNSLNAPTLSTNIQQWLNSEYMAKIGELGLKKMAIIMPQKATAKSSVNRMSSSEESKAATDIMEMQFFNTVEDSIRWIESV